MQVPKLAADIRKIARDLRDQRELFARIGQAVQNLDESDRRISFTVPPRNLEKVGILEDVREENESISSSSSSRSSSRASRRSLSRTRSTSSLGHKRTHGINDVSGDGKPTVIGLRHRASNSSLRIGEDGTPLGDDELEGGEGGNVSRSNEVGLSHSSLIEISRQLILLLTIFFRVL